MQGKAFLNVKAINKQLTLIHFDIWEHRGYYEIYLTWPNGIMKCQLGDNTKWIDALKADHVLVWWWKSVLSDRGDGAYGLGGDER